MYVAKNENKIILIYLVFGYLWILLSDSFIKNIFDNQIYINQFQTYKGWLYVSITGVLFYYIIHKTMVELRKKQKELEIQNTELNEVNHALKKSNKEVRELQDEIIVSLSKLLEFHDQYTEGHSKNVADLVLKIAEGMGLSKKEFQQAYWAGILHDIGKILVPASILNKENRLTDEEYNLIKNHSYWGYQTLLQSKKLKEIASYVLYHHERWDGKGYPEGLKGEEIPLISQIISLADSWDAMTSKRAYREALSEEEAIQEIEKNKGTQFSPFVVDAFLKNCL